MMRNLNLLFWSAVAGLSCSLISLIGMRELVFRSVGLAVSLSAGVLLVNQFSRARLNEGKPPRMELIFGMSLVSGLIAAGFVKFGAWIYSGIDQHDPDGILPPILDGYSAAALCFGYSVILHFAYGLRWKINKGRGFLTFCFITLAGVIWGMVRESFDRDEDELGAYFMLSLFTGFPFAISWAIAVMACDPAWSFERWKDRV